MTIAFQQDALVVLAFPGRGVSAETKISPDRASPSRTQAPLTSIPRRVVRTGCASRTPFRSAHSVAARTSHGPKRGRRPVAPHSPHIRTFTTPALPSGYHRSTDPSSSSSWSGTPADGGRARIENTRPRPSHFGHLCDGELATVSHRSRTPRAEATP